MVLTDGGGKEGGMGYGGSSKQGVPYAVVEGVSCWEWRRVEGGTGVEECWVQA